jgi:dolichol-phosphate mannosyltransferase
MKLSVVIPAHNEVDSIAETVVSISARLEDATIDHEIIVVDDASVDDTAALVRSLAAANPRVRYERSPLPPGFGHAVRHGLSCYSGDAVAIMMADASDSPDDLIAYYGVLTEGYQ